MLVKNRGDLLKVLSKEIDKNKGLTVIQAGHFALIPDNDALIPAIFQDVKNNKLKHDIKSHIYMGSFPLNTWKAGLVLASYCRKNNKKSKLVILVNDWQWVPKANFGGENKLREIFYQSSQLPRSYKKELDKNDISEKNIIPFKNKNGKINNNLFFSEQKLRNQFGNYYSPQCSLDNSCAQEYIPLLLQLSKEKVKLFISFIPRTCMLPINGGSTKAKESYDLDMKIINVFANGTYKHDFWENVDISIL